MSILEIGFTLLYDIHWVFENLSNWVCKRRLCRNGMKFFIIFTLTDYIISGILLDNYQISHYTDSLFPSSEFKTDAILKEETLSYGAMVNDSYLAKCFRKLIAEDKYLLYDFTRHELTKTLKVIFYCSFSVYYTSLVFFYSSRAFSHYVFFSVWN